MKLKKLKKHFEIILAISFVTFFFSTCQIGLGAAVDTEVPGLNILIPNPDKVDVIRGAFPISGTWSDDGTIDSVEVTISSGDKTVLKENAEVVKNEEEVGKGSWTYIVSPSEKNLSDGSYGISVKIKDKAGHFSLTSGQIIIDNTPPIVILERPSTYVDSSDVDAFGETLSLLGQVADETGVSKVSMNVFSDKECQNSLLSKPIDFTSVTNLDETVAKFEAGNNENIYYQLYGQATKDDAKAKTLYFTITSYDGAHRYPVDGNSLPDDELGNVSNTYYLSSAVSALVGEYTINGLYKVLNGTYATSDRSAVDSVSSQLEASKIPVGSFSLNPKNNPTFVVSGKTQLPEAFTSESLAEFFEANANHIKNKTSVQIEVSPGLDGIALDISSLKPYVQVLQLADGKTSGDKIYLDVTNTSMSGSVCKMEVPLVASKEKGFSVGKNYKFGVEGSDKSKNTIADSGTGFAFHFSSSGDGPKLSVTDPVSDNFYKAKDAPVIISGLVEYEEAGSLSVSMSPVSSGDESLITVTSEYNADGMSYNADETGKIFTFSYQVPAEKFKTDKSDEYTIVVSALADGVTQSIQKTVKYDVKNPEITIDEPSPKSKLYSWKNGVESASAEDYINGTISFSVTIEDDVSRNETSNPPLVTLKGKNKTETHKITQFPTQAFTVDTSAYGDGDFTITVDAYDLAGNKGTTSKTYKILQDTDKPFIIPSYPIVTKSYFFETAEAANSAETKIAAETDIYFRVIDDDDPDSNGSGLKSIAISLQRRSDLADENGNYEYTPVLTSDGKTTLTDTNNFYKNNDGSAYKYALPGRSGTYKLTIAVKDKNDALSELTTYLYIKPANPKLSSFNLGKEYVSESVSLPIDFEITSDQIPFRITKKIDKEDGFICNFEDYNSLPDIDLEADVENVTLTKKSDTQYKYQENIVIEKGLLSEHKYESGNYKLQYRVYDKNGVAVTSSIQAFKVDLDGPEISDITVPNVDETEEASLNFEIKASDSGAGIANYYIYFSSSEIADTSSIAASAWLPADTTYSKAVAGSPVFASSGQKFVYVYVKDSVGNKSSVSSEAFDFDTRKPNASIVVENASGLVSAETANRYNTGSAFSLPISADDDWGLESLTLIQTCEGGTNEISIDLSGQSGDIKNFNWTVGSLPKNPGNLEDTEPYVESGVYTYTLKAVDKANKTKTSDAIVVKIDKEPPVISVDSIASSGLLSGSAAVFTGTVSDVAPNDSEHKGTDTGIDKVLYVIKNEIDDEGNQIPPSEAEWDSADENDKKAIVSSEKWRIEQSLGSGTAGNVITRGDLQEGEYWLYVRAKDKAGNISVNEENTPNPLHFIVDQGKPEVLSASLTVKQAVENSADVLVYQSQTLSSSSTAYINADYSSHKFIIEGVIKETYGLPEDWLSVKVGDTIITNPEDPEAPRNLEISKTALTGDANKGKYSYTITLTNLTNVADNTKIPVTITVKDVTGKDDRKSSITYYIYNDKIAPSLSITNPATNLNESNYITGSSFIFSADVSDVDAHNVSASGLKDSKFKYLFTKTPFADEAAIKASAKTGTGWTDSVTIDSGVSWSLTKALIANSETTNVAGKLKEGLWYLYLYAVDNVGNEVTGSRSFWIDQAKPELTLSSSGSETTNTGFTLSMTASDANGIKSIEITDKYTLADGTTSGSHTYNVYDESSAYTLPVTKTQGFTLGSGEGQLADGLHNFTIVTKDRMDRETSKKWSVLVDTKEPEGSLTLESASYTDSESKKWYKSQYAALKVSANDIVGGANTGFVSGVAKVEAAVTAEAGVDIQNPSWIELPKSGNDYKNSIQLRSQGANTIAIRVTDKAGNVVTKNSEGDTKTAYWDSQAPEKVSITSIKVGDAEKYSTELKTLPVNGREAITITFTASDNAPSSGIKTRKLKKPVQNEITAERVSSDPTNENYNNWKVEIPATAIKTGIISIDVEDNVGNISTTTSDINIVLDNTSPVVKKINLPLDADTTNDSTTAGKKIDVNGTVSLSGTVSDNRSTLQSLDVYYYVDSTVTGQQTWVSIYHGTDANWSVSTENVINTTALTTAGVPDGTAIYIVPVAIDEVGNCNLDVKNADNSITPRNSITGLAPSDIAASNKAVIYLNQDSDRPVITLYGLNFTGMASNSHIGFKSSILTGSVSDDDGVSKFEYKLDDKDWTEVTPNNTSFTINKIPDNKHTLLFKVTDSAGKTWETSATANKSGPKLTDGTRHLAYNEAASTAVYLKVDTTPPVIGNLKYKRSNEANFETFNDGEAFGGSSENQFWIQFDASDNNGIVQLTAQLDAKDGDKDASGNSITEANYDSYYKRAITFTTGSSVTGHNETAFDVTGMASGYRDIILTASDGIYEKTTTYQIKIDNDAPIVNVTSHSENELILTSFILKGSFTDGDEETELKYLITDNETTPSDSDWTNAVEISGNTALSWQITFDKSALSATEVNGYTHDSEPKYLVKRLLGNLVTIDSASGAVVYASDGTGSNTYKAGDKYTSQVPCYLHFYVVDSFGNHGTSKFKFIIDPTGETPIVSLTYPAKEEDWSVNEGSKPLAKLSGKIRASGSARTINALEGVYIQIDPVYDSANGFAANWYEKSLPNSDFTGSFEANMNTLGYDFKDIGNSGKKGIKISSNETWNITLNNRGEFENADGNNYIAIRLYAVDVNNNVSSTADSDIFIIRIDAGAPEIGSSVPLQLKQYSDNENGSGTITKVMNYSDGMYLSGEWWLTGSVEDSSGIESIKIYNTEKINNTELTSDEKGTEQTWGTKSGYLFKYKVGNATPGAAGTLSYTIVAKEKDAKGSETSSSISLKYDNKAPVLQTKGGSFYNISEDVVSSNGFYTVQSGAQEGVAESGFKMAVFYFKRTITGYENVYDSYLKRGTTGNTLAQSSLTQEDGLFWKTGITVSSGNGAINGRNVTVSSIDNNVHVGGLAKLGGVIYRIDSINGNVLTLDAAPDESLTGSNIYFAIGHVVDHIGSENEGSRSNVISSDKYYGYYKNTEDGVTSDDDGDHMVETVSTDEGAAYAVTKWAGTINCNNIPDGPIEIHYVVFDKAGNHSSGAVTTAKVKNNAPRLAGLTVTSGSTTNTFYYGGMPRMISGQSVRKATALTDRLVVSGNGKDARNGGTAFMTVKADITFTPELVGGNGDLYYSYRVEGGSHTDENSTVTTQNSIELTEVPTSFGSGNADGFDDYADSNGYYKNDSEGSEYYEGHAAGNITFSRIGKLGANSDSNTPTWFYYTIWDSTEGTTKIEDRMNVSFECALSIDYYDTVKPDISISDLYWNSNSDNSLYLNSRDNGHIELKADVLSLPVESALRKAPFGETAKTTYDKVSGKITMRGIATDNMQVKSLWVKIDGFKPFENATQDSDGYVQVYGTNLSSTSSMETDGWTCSVTSVTDANDAAVKEGKHKVNWQFSFNTEEIGENGVGTNVHFYIKAQDDAGSRGNSGVNNSSSEKAYTMDVVPYITRVITSLSSIQADAENAVYGKKASVFDRTALGHYPVYVIGKDSTITGGEAVKIKGFNLGTNTSFNSTELTTTADSTNNSTSAKYSISVSGRDYSKENQNVNIKSINNLNNNNSCGSYETEITNGSVYSVKNNYAYNRLPNNDNNNNLTDDVVFDVWQFNSAAAIPVSGKIDQAVMKINPRDGKIGFTFVNGSFNVSLANGKENGNSYQTWIKSSDFCTSTNFVYDKLGYSYGVLAGGDTQTGSHSDKYNIVTSRWGVADTGNGGTESKNKRNRRIDELKDTSDSSAFMKQRFLGSSLATAVHGSSTNLYLAYYESQYGQIRFKYGNISATPDSDASDFGNFVDACTSASGNSYKQARKYVQILASDGSPSDKPTYSIGKPGPYVSIGVISAQGEIAANGTADDIVVATWYGSDRTLWYSYNTTPTVNRADTSRIDGKEVGSEENTDGWSDPVRVFSSTSDEANAGEYCKLAVDAKGGVHIAAFDSANNTVVYAYLASAKNGAANAQTDFATCLVDGNAPVGEYLTLDVALADASASVGTPYIGYYSQGSLRPKMAYPVASPTLAGTDNNAVMTGNWEITVVPTPKKVETQSNQHNPINIGVWKTNTAVAGESTNGVIKASSTGTSKAEIGKGTCYGNGTKNPVLGYVITDDTIETAQKK